MRRTAGPPAVRGAHEATRVVTRPFVALWLSAFSGLVTIGMLLPIVPVYAKGLGAGDVLVGVSVAATTPAAALLQPLAGRLADRRGRRPLLVLGPLGFAAGVVALTLVDSVAGLIAVRTLMGIAEAAIFTSTATVVNDLAPDERRGEAVSLFSVATWSGIAVGPLLGEALLDGDHFDRVWVAAALMSCLAAAFALAVPETRPALRLPPGRLAFVSRAALLPGLVMIAAMVGFASITAFTPLYARELGLGGAAGAMGLYATAVIGVRLAARKVPDRLGPHRTATLAVVVVSAGLATIGLVRSPGGLYAGAAVLGVGSAFVFPALMMLVISRADPSERSAAVGTFSACSEVGYAFGAIVLGVVADVQGYASVYLAAAAIAALGLIPLRRLAQGRPVVLEAVPETPG